VSAKVEVVFVPPKSSSCPDAESYAIDDKYRAEGPLEATSVQVVPDQDQVSARAPLDPRPPKRRSCLVAGSYAIAAP
jgi:hypothetical protein